MIHPGHGEEPTEVDQVDEPEFSRDASSSPAGGWVVLSVGTLAVIRAGSDAALSVEDRAQGGCGTTLEHIDTALGEAEQPITLPIVDEMTLDRGDPRPWEQGSTASVVEFKKIGQDETFRL